MLRIGYEEWLFARQGADWDDEDEKLSVEIIKAMAWRVGVDVDEYAVVMEMARGKRFIDDIGDLLMATEYCGDESGKLVLDVVRVEDVDGC